MKTAREHADKIWNTQDLSDISDFNIPLSAAVGMMENFSNERNSELLERYNESIEVLEELASQCSQYATFNIGSSKKQFEKALQTISKAKP